jgi:RNase P subunit RPR2
MDCERCNGWMMPERRVGYSADDELIQGVPWRCVNCGNVVDLVIIRNRAGRVVPAASTA